MKYTTKLQVAQIWENWANGQLVAQIWKKRVTKDKPVAQIWENCATGRLVAQILKEMSN